MTLHRDSDSKGSYLPTAGRDFRIHELKRENPEG